MTPAQTAIVVALMALATFATRGVSFLLFPPSRPTPKAVVYLGKVLPFAITGMLIVFCLKGVKPLEWPYGLPEVIGIGVVAGLYLTVKNSLLAIAAGTIVYMLLVQLVF